MRKRAMRDIAPNDKRSIRNVKRADIEDTKRSRRHDTGSSEADEHTHTQEGAHEGTHHAPEAKHAPASQEGGGGGKRMPPRRGRMQSAPADRARRRFWKWTSITVVAVILLIFLFSTVFAGATIRVTPIYTTVEVDHAFTTYTEPEGGQLGYERTIVSETASRDIPASGTEEVAQKASGTIIVYNAYSSSDQPLVENTRFEAPNGNIYRIRESVVVPGTTVQEGEVVPGSLEVEVYADQAGEEYNIGKVDFTIPGFKGGPRYEDFYARSKTKITGGMEGTVNVVPDGALEQARTDLTNELKATLLEKTYGQVPERFILYEDAAFFAFSGNNPQTQSGDGDEVTFTMKGTLRGVLFDRKELSRHIAQKTLSQYDGKPVLIRDLEAFDFQMRGRSAITNPFSEDALTFVLSGTTDLEWVVDTESLKEDVRGAPKEDFTEIAEGYATVKRAEASLTPFWLREFPQARSDIEIVVDHPGDEK